MTRWLVSLPPNRHPPQRTSHFDPFFGLSATYQPPPPPTSLYDSLVGFLRHRSHLPAKTTHLRLGVDHVSHRVGPDRPSMKLQQMNDALTRVIEKFDDNTLLIVLGDHGMDRSGDHGGDGILETSSAMWIYSKGHALTDTSLSVPSGLLQFKTFPETTIQHRSIQQINIVPTLSLLLRLPNRQRRPPSPPTSCFNSLVARQPILSSNCYHSCYPYLQSLTSSKVRHDSALQFTSQY